MNLLRRLAVTLCRPLSTGRAALRRRPRQAAAAGLLTILVALLIGGELILLTGTPAPAPAPAGPTFTTRDGWTLAELERHVAAGEVEAITALPASADRPAGEVLVRLRDGRIVTVELTVGASDAVAALTSLGYGRLLTSEALAIVRPPAAAGPTSGGVLGLVLPIALLVVMMVFIARLSRRAGTSGRESSTKFMTILPPDPQAASAAATTAAGSLVPVGLADVAGCDEAKFELTEAIEFLKTPERFRRLGAHIPRGIMLYGPPGTGKTMLARAVAAEAGVPFHYASGSEFVEKYVGVGAKRIRDLFAQARRLGRGVIFFDEFDAIGKARGGPNSHEEREQTLNQLLVELDGFATTDDVIVIAATNRLDTLDSAILRPGRFTRKIHVGMPDVKGRRAILDVHARNKPMAALTDLDETARKTYGFSGAMLADLLNEAAILAARRGGDVIDDTDLHGGWLKVAVGTSRRRSMDERERSIIAAHEVGHAICGKVHGDKRKVEEISLFAHGEALGVTVSSQEDNDLPSESDLRARLVALMGGRAAEEILFHEVTGGAANDFEAANRIATAMVTKWGMGSDPEATDGGVSGRGVLSFFVPTGGRSLPSEVQPAATRAIRAILDEAYAEASRTLVTHLETLRRLAAYLVEHERVDGGTFDELFDGTRHVPTAGDEWRAATSRPRAWGDVVDLAGRRRQREPGGVSVAATSSPTSGAADEPEPGMVSASARSGGHETTEAAPSPIVNAVAEPAGLTSLSGPVAALDSAPTRPRSGPAIRRRAGGVRQSLARRTRSVAASWLHRAEQRLRPPGLEADRS